MEIMHVLYVLVSRLSGDLQHICSEEDLQPIDLPSLAEYVPTPPAHRHFWFCFCWLQCSGYGTECQEWDLYFCVSWV